MVGIVIVSHSDLVARGVKEIAGQMAPEVKIEAAGGTSDNRIGTSIDKITDAIQKVYSEDGVMIFFDLGSAFMNTEMAVEFLDDSMKKKVQIVDASLIEGVVVAAVECSMKKSIDEVKMSLKGMALNKI